MWWVLVVGWTQVVALEVNQAAYRRGKGGGALRGSWSCREVNLSWEWGEVQGLLALHSCALGKEWARGFA